MKQQIKEVELKNELLKKQFLLFVCFRIQVKEKQGMHFANGNTDFRFSFNKCLKPFLILKLLGVALFKRCC